MAGREVLDSKFLKGFIENELAEFRAELKKILQDDDTQGRSIGYIAEDQVDVDTMMAKRPLIIGPMAGSNSSDIVGGGELNKLVIDAAKDIHRILLDHEVMFEDMEEACRETIEKMTKTQNANLESIKADTFVDVFEDLDDNTSGGNDDK